MHLPRVCRKERRKGVCGGERVCLCLLHQEVILDLSVPKATPPGKSVLLTGLSEKMVDIFRPH